MIKLISQKVCRSRSHLLLFNESAFSTSARTNSVTNLQPQSTASAAKELPQNVADLIKEKPKQVINPLKNEDFFDVKKLVKMEDLFK